MARRFLYLVVCFAPVWAVITYATDGVAFHLGGLRLKATEPVRPLVVGGISAAIYIWRYSRGAYDLDGAWLMALLRRAAIVALPVIVLIGGFLGIHYGSFTAGGSDAYGYVSQAALWLKGSLRIEQPWVQQFSWPAREVTFAPLGYRPISTNGTIVPTYASGLPILMALFQAAFGTNGPFFVVPLLGAMALWFTYLLGRAVSGSRAVGALASMLLLTSPVFLSHLLMPMSDVPVAAGWTLVAVLALKKPRPPALAAGFVAAATLMIRPNLVLLALVPIITWLNEWRDRRAEIVRFAVGLAPGIIAIAALNTYLYGSPLTSGYGALGDIYSLSSAWPNLKRYSLWLVQTQTPMVALAVIPLVVPSVFARDGRSAWLCVTSLLGLSLVSYIFYSPFELWTYLRFLLPAYPALFVLMAMGIRYICGTLPVPLRAPAAMLICVICLASTFIFSRDQFIFDARKFQQRHIQAAEHVAELTPEMAVILCAEHSGSLRYYAHRLTLRYDLLSDDKLDFALQELRAKGYHPYIVVDDWEEREFRKRFASKNHAGRLDWTPIITVMTNPQVRIYDSTGQ